MKRKKRGIPVRRRGASARGRLLAWFFGACIVVMFGPWSAAHAAPDVDPPPASVCNGPPPPPQDTGSTPITPGRWWNNKRVGTGWDFFWGTNNQQLTAAWYTYNRAARPTWLFTNSPDYDTATRTWRAQLLKFRWLNGSVSPEQRVGSVALTFLENDPTRVALAWQWDEVDEATREECLFDYFRPGPAPSAIEPGTREANAAHSGFWYEPLKPGWGALINIGQTLQTTPSQYIELNGLAVYDDADEPVWLDTQVYSALPPPDAAQLPLNFYRAKPDGYPSGVPINDCLTVAACVQGYPGVATFERTFTSAATGTARVVVNVAGSAIGGGSGIHWNRPLNGTDPAVQIKKLTTPHGITVDRLTCQVASGQGTCQITVNWATTGTASRAFRRDLLTGQATMLLDDATGTYRHSGRKLENLSAGAKVQYELYSGPTTGYTQLARSPTVTATGAPIVGDQAIESLAAELPAHNAALGAMDGSASVDGGAASYSIPIKVAPGRRGMEPRLSLNYSSRGGAGIGGLGVSLSGLSSIHRCPATPEQDGLVRAVRFVSGDSGDRLCLDGQRLVKVSVGSQYGLAGTQYRKEIDDFTRVTLETAGGDINSATSYFKVESRSGEVGYYGGVSPSDGGSARTVPSGVTAPLAWQVRRREDRVGNNVIFAYALHGPGEYLIDTIYYTGFNGAQGDRTVRFLYATRSNTAAFPDQSSSYLAGSLTRQTKRLDKIQTFAGSAQVREYRIGGYGASPVSGRGRSTSITECAYESGVPTCLPPTTFTWQDSPVGQAAHQFATAPLVLSGLPQPVLSNPGEPAALPIGFGYGGDYDGDGSRDIIAKVRSGAGAYTTYLVSVSADRSINGYYAVPSQTFLQGSWAGAKAFVADFDNDGRADLPRQYASKFAISSWTAGVGSYAGGAFNEPPFTPGGAAGIAMGTGDTLEYAGDVNGDGKADVVVSRPSALSRCTGRELDTYFNTTPSGASVSFDFANPLRTCLPLITTPQRVAQSRVGRIADFDGNGLVDVMVELDDVCAPGFCEITERSTDGDFFLMGTRDVAGGACTGQCNFTWTQTSYASVFSTVATADEMDRRLFALWLDLNGDGLDDLLYAENAASARGCSSPACWSFRLNRGLPEGSVAFLADQVRTPSDAGIEFCAGSIVGSGCLPGPFQPKYGGLIRVADVDADGRTDLLIPNARQPFAAMVCQHHDPIPFHPPGTAPDVCAYIPPRSANDPLAPGAEWDGAVPCGKQFYMCPENPRTDIAITQTTRQAMGDDGDVRISTNGLGTLNETRLVAIADLWDATAQTAYLGGAISRNPTIYNMNVLRLYDAGGGAASATEVEIPGLTASAQGAGSISEFSDIYGDGLTDHLFYSGCFESNTQECGVPYRNSLGQPFEVPQDLFGNPAILAKTNYLSENLGVGRRTVGGQPQTNLPPLLPDMLLSVTNAAGVVSTWDYFPLGSKAGRTSSETPFYTVPTNTAQRYIDDKHFYFTSSMAAVAELFQSDGVGGLSMTSYGYSEAMYNHQRRGFRGFRNIVVDDTTSRRRTTTTFAQKYPLTGAAERVDVNSTARPGDDGLISREERTWRCFDTPATLPATSPAIPRSTGCVAPAQGATKTIMPFVDSVVATTYDAAAAENPLAGAPAPIAVSTTTNADDPALTGNYSSTSGFDVYGNLNASVTVTQDLGNGTPGFRTYVAAQRKRVTRSFAAADISSWWLDKVNSEQLQTRIDFDAGNPLPGGVGNPLQTLNRSYAWNANRTPQSETLQPGVSNQQVVTTYGYPGTNYGLPSSITVQASGDPNGSRATSTVYTADGYFPAQTTNAVGRTTTTTFRNRDGQASLIVDPNGFRTTFQYDAFGRVIRTLLRGTSDTVYRQPDRAEAWSSCAGNCPPYTYRVRTVVQDGAPTTVEYQDLFGRTLRVDTRLLDLTTSAVETRYNNRGLVTQTSEPYRLGTAPVWTTFGTYDVLGRVRQKTVPKQLNDGLGDLRTNYTYAGRQTRIDVQGTFDSCPGSARCLTLYRETDALGRITWTQDAIGGATRYWFDGDGNALAIQDASNAITSASYNAVGQRSNVADPNMGASVYTYNALGEVLTRRDARNITTSFSYDKLGRTLTRFASVDVTGEGSPDSVSDGWLFDPPGAFGQLSRSSRTINSVLEKSSTYTYDSLARPTRKTSQQNQGGGVTQTFTTDTAYDAYYGRPKLLTYPSGDSVWLRYTRYGQLNRESDWPNTQDYRRITAVTARGQSQTELFGAALTASYAYTGNTGQMTSAVYTKPGSTVRQLGYRYDVFGNVTRQELGGGTTYEDYGYDKLMRLTQATRGGGAGGVVAYGYDAVGNFTSKSDYGSSYTYSGGACGGGPNAVKTVSLAAGGTRTLCYDASGNLSSFTTSGGTGESFSARYDHDNLPFRTTRAGTQVDLSYDADGGRVRQSGADGTRLYDGGYEKVLTPAIEHKVYLGDYGVLTRPNGGAPRVNYLLKDRLGSVDTVTDAAGNTLETRGYDAFGKPRQGTWADAVPPKLASTANTPRGFTQHEHLNAVQLIHMNGRAYDYQLGRFLSVDPIIQFPTNSQSLNPYSYILNNPLSGTDPSGYAANTCDVGANKSCLQDGENIITEDGKTVATIHVATKGQHLNFTTSNGASFGATFTGRSGEITRALTGKGITSIGEISSRTNGTLEGTGLTSGLGPDASRGTFSALPESARVAGGPRQSYCDSFTCDLSHHAGRVLWDMRPTAGLSQGYEDWQQGNYGSAAWNIGTDLPIGKLAKGISAGAGALLPLIRGSSDTLRAFKSSNFRENLGRITGNIPFGSQAHHLFPQKFAERFEKLGINVHDPRFGAWWDAVEHGKHSRAYNDAWDGFFQGNPTQQGALDLARDLASRYGYGVNF